MRRSSFPTRAGRKARRGACASLRNTLVFDPSTSKGLEPDRQIRRLSGEAIEPRADGRAGRGGALGPFGESLALGGDRLECLCDGLDGLHHVRGCWGAAVGGGDLLDDVSQRREGVVRVGEVNVPVLISASSGDLPVDTIDVIDRLAMVSSMTMECSRLSSFNEASGPLERSRRPAQ